MAGSKSAVVSEGLPGKILLPLIMKVITVVILYRILRIVES
jgi:hypothetical protein